MNAYSGIRSIAPLILTLGTRWRYNPTFTLRLFAHGKGFLCTLGEPWKRSRLSRGTEIPLITSCSLTTITQLAAPQSS